MSIDKKTFGISDSLVDAVNEALKGGQKKIDVAPPFGKLTGADFKKLRGEDAKPDYLDFDKDGNKKEPMKQALKQKNEVADANKANFKANMKEEQVDEAAAVGAPVPNMAAAMDARKAQVQRTIAQKQAAFQNSKAKKRIAGTVKEAHKCSCGETNESKMKCEVHGGPRNRQMVKGGKEQIIMNPPLKEASDLPKKVVTKGHEIAKSLIKHRAKVKSPYAVGMATAKKSAGIKEEAQQVDELSKETMKSYVKAVDKRGESMKRGTGLNVASQKIAKQEPTSTLKKTVDAIKKKPHGKLKSSTVNKFFASHAELQKRGVKEEAEQVDELSRGTMNSYVRKSHNQTLGVDAVGMGTKKSGIPGYYKGKNKDLGKDPAQKVRMRKAGQALAIKKMNKEDVQVDEVLDNPIKKMSYIAKAYKQIKHADPIKMANNPKEFQKVAKRTVGMQMLNKKLTKKKD